MAEAITVYLKKPRASRQRPKGKALGKEGLT